ncbi:MAG: Glu-tRNA(Gln) amidotransferase subunit GatE [Candidatus Aenigmarchaeota archaeon]|nr:Glu-tRNA(Gln) amidotransferase subunit GatE [Candidatus Aenigmarchaeota archaeon]
MDYEKLGLKCGIEIHQQLDTGRKLFCSCEPTLDEENPDRKIIRRLRPVKGEGGTIDAAVAEEKMKNREFHYFSYPRSTCLVEMDEEPPHEMDSASLETSIEAGMLMDCIMPDEIIIMRKLVIDGSDTTGFQRTCLIGFDGKVKTSFGDVGITNINLEEDSAQILNREEKEVHFGLNRLGIPLIEIGTTPDVRTPEQARELAEKIGMILRSTGKVKRGLGTIRQDINVSIKEGARVEIKGAQDLNTIPKWVEYEVERQMRLIEIRNELKEKKFKDVVAEVKDVSKIFKDSECKITNGKTTFAILIPGFAGYLKRHLTPTRTLGNEIANYVKVKGGIKGVIHTDENLEKYKLEKEFLELGKFMKAKEGDTLMIAVASKKDSEKSLKVAAERINQILSCIPEETRRALEDGNSEYMRPLPGASRMYPETDLLPIPLTKEMLLDIGSHLPELWDDMILRLAKDYGISTEISNQIVRSGRGHLFEKLVKGGADARTLATTLTITLSEIKRQEGLPVEDLTDKNIEDVFSYFAKGKINKPLLPKVFSEMILNPKTGLDEIIRKLDAHNITHDEVREIIAKVVAENKELANNERAEKILMGMCMEKLRGRADGKIVMDVLREEIEKHRC